MLVGLDQIATGQFSATRRRLRSSRVAVLTHSAATDRRGYTTLEALEELGVHPRVLFTPEHGLDGAAQAQEAVPSPDGNDSEWSLRSISLYGDTKESLSPSAEQLSGIDVLLIDLCDVGSRYYTYVWTALLAARAARAAGVHTLLLDRPNPISGDPSLLEGAPQAEGFLSFVGLEPIPIRHSLTLGEIVVRYLQQDGAELGPEGAVSVVPVRGWERHKTARAWGRPFIPPSPNMPSIETALVYPGGCLLEGTNLSEGRGTTLPFLTIGAPFLDAEKFAHAMRDAVLPGVIARPVGFKPSFDKYAGELCGGVMLHVTDELTFRPVTTYLTLINVAKTLAPDDFQFTTDPYEFETEIPAFDLLTGSSAAREAILEGSSSTRVAELVAPVPEEWQQAVWQAETDLARALA
ncbi:MAG: exo-beta-N-acetylmuramidase NamZ domain-containing protein [Polyangiaceae bacterium]